MDLASIDVSVGRMAFTGDGRSGWIFMVWHGFTSCLLLAMI